METEPLRTDTEKKFTFDSFFVSLRLLPHSQMTKRRADFGEGTTAKKKNRSSQSSEGQLANGSSTVKNIESAEDLRLLLSSTQLNLDALLKRVAAFKSFLDVIARSESEKILPETSLLLKYLHTQLSTEDEDRPRLVPDVINIAHHAGQINSDNLFSSITTVIALLLKTLSSLHQFCDIGNSLCRLLLHEDHIKLVEHGMSAAKPKEHLISPCLRLLKEVVLFDGGRAARAVYRRRHVTFQRLDVFLSMRGVSKDDGQGNRKRSSVRNNAISYLLANLRLQSQNAKCYILGQNKWMKSLLSDIGKDGPGLVRGVVDALRRDVAEDRRLPLTVRGRFFDDWTLGRLVTLYGYKNDISEDQKPSIQDSTHALFQTIFVSSDYSLLAALESEQSQEELEEDGDEADEEYSSAYRSADLRKMKRSLVSFLKRLRPHASILQSNLLLSCFHICPQLFEDFFSDKAAFSFDPKLTVTWIGYSQFLFGIIRQPIPKGLIRRPIDRHDQYAELVINHILPPPLTRKVSTQCLNQSSTLITFFITRILVAAFKKFIAVRKVLETCQQADTNLSKLSRLELGSKLLNCFCQRLPKFKDIIIQFKSCPAKATMLRESLLRLLTLHYTETPQLALAETFDISTALSNSLADLDAAEVEGDEDGMCVLNLEHLIQIASRSPSMHWWHKPGRCWDKPCSRTQS